MAKSSKGGKDAPRGGGKGSGGGKGQARRRKWEVERARRRRRQAIPWVVLVVAIVSVVAGAAVLNLSTPQPSGEDGPCDYPRIPLQHYHANLYIFRDGATRNVPGDIGINPALTVDTSLRACTSGDPAHGASPVHTHAGEANILHIETIVDRTYTLGDFFRTWGEPLGPDAVWDMNADANHRLSLLVDGQPSDAWGDLVLSDGMTIRIDYITV